MLDPIKQEDKELLKKAVEIVNRKVMPVNKEAKFLRSFVLALMKQYRYYEEPKQEIKIDRFNLPYFPTEKKRNVERAVAEFKVPKPNRIKLNIPRPIILSVKEKIPRPVELLPNIPKPL